MFDTNNLLIIQRISEMKDKFTYLELSNKIKSETKCIQDFHIKKILDSLVDDHKLDFNGCFFIKKSSINNFVV